MSETPIIIEELGLCDECGHMVYWHHGRERLYHPGGCDQPKPLCPECGQLMDPEHNCKGEKGCK